MVFGTFRIRFYNMDGIKISVIIMEDLQITFKYGVPYGIRDKNGYLFFFVKISKFLNQEHRYQEEIKEQIKLAEYLLEQLELF